MKSHHPGCMSDEECRCQDIENEAEIESDTPETDATEWYDAMCDPDRVVASDFARRLERERDEARKALILTARWGIQSDGYSAGVAASIKAWIDGGMTGPAPKTPDYYPT